MANSLSLYGKSHGSRSQRPSTSTGVQDERATELLADESAGGQDESVFDRDRTVSFLKKIICLQFVTSDSSIVPNMIVCMHNDDAEGTTTTLFYHLRRTAACEGCEWNAIIYPTPQNPLSLPRRCRHRHHPSIFPRFS